MISPVPMMQRVSLYQGAMGMHRMRNGGIDGMTTEAGATSITKWEGAGRGSGRRILSNRAGLPCSQQWYHPGRWSDADQGIGLKLRIQCKGRTAGRNLQISCKIRLT